MQAEDGEPQNETEYATRGRAEKQKTGLSWKQREDGFLEKGIDDLVKYLQER